MHFTDIKFRLQEHHVHNILQLLSIQTMHNLTLTFISRRLIPSLTVRRQLIRLA